MHPRLDAANWVKQLVKYLLSKCGVAYMEYSKRYDTSLGKSENVKSENLMRHFDCIEHYDVTCKPQLRDGDAKETPFGERKVPALRSAHSEAMARQMQLLQKAQLDCKRTMSTEPVNLSGSYCPRTWDTLMCWPDTPAGVTVFQQCPGYIHGFDQSQQASRQCLENGTWFKSDLTGRSWTNYSLCIMNTVTTKSVHPLIVQHMQGIKLMSTIGYTLSLAALILAVSIMVCFRRLHCARNLIHLNMFVAFLIRAAFSLLKTVLLVKDLGFPMDVKVTGQGVEFIQEGSHWACKLFFTLFHYVIFASLMGLFNEGLYLVLILSLSVFVDRIKIRCFVLLGWGVPVIFIVPWVVCRMVFDDILCWNVHVRRDILWILRAPMMASVAVDFAFFIHIVRLLFTKLTAFNCPESRRVRYRKLAKSTLILIPLFAVYYIGFMWLPDHLSAGSDLFKLYAEMLFNSFQGFLVALLFCFLNAEVQNEIRKKWREHVVDRNGSWRSRHSLCSFLPRSVSTPKAKGQGHAPSNPQHPSNPDARSSVLPPVVVVAAITVDKNRVTVTPIRQYELPAKPPSMPDLSKPPSGLTDVADPSKWITLQR